VIAEFGHVSGIQRWALPLGTDGEFLAAAGAAPGKNGPAVLGLHARAEPVRFGAMAVVRLKSTFRHFIPSYKYKTMRALRANRA
jgi:hypothetical protein